MRLAIKLLKVSFSTVSSPGSPDCKDKLSTLDMAVVFRRRCLQAIERVRIVSSVLAFSAFILALYSCCTRRWVFARSSGVRLPLNRLRPEVPLKGMIVVIVTIAGRKGFEEDSSAVAVGAGRTESRSAPESSAKEKNERHESALRMITLALSWILARTGRGR